MAETLETTEIQKFENASMIIFQKLADFKKMKDEMEAAEKKLKDDLQKSMEAYGIKSFKNDVVTLSYIEASTSETIDLKAMQEKEPKLYAELLADYKKVKKTSAYVRIQVK